MKSITISRETIPQQSGRNMMGAWAAIALTGVLAACGGGRNAATNPTPVSHTAVQVNMGDAPSDWMLAFSMNISSMSLTGSNGSVTAVSSTTPMEMMHLMGTVQPLAMISAPQESYTSASISIGSATVMYMDPTTKTRVQKTISGPVTAMVNFSSPITVGTTPMAITFDMDLASSVAMDAGGNLTMNPVFRVTSGMQGSGDSKELTYGGIQQLMGIESSASGSSFTMSSVQAAPALTFTTNSSTVFDNITNMSMMTDGMLLMVDASLQADGSLMATRVQSMMNSGGVMGGGVITTVSGKPATELTIVMRTGAGAGMMSSALAGGVTVDLGGSVAYKIDTDNIDLSNLPFTPQFDGNHIYGGQAVMPISSGGMMSGGSGGMMGGGQSAGTITASDINLEHQGLSGTITNTIIAGSPANFALTLPSDSAFTTLTGSPSVTVYQQPGTIVSGTASMAGGTIVHVFGLLFFDSGQWKMVASRIASR